MIAVDKYNSCANCECSVDIAPGSIVGSSCYDGEWCCSGECDDMIDELWCPFEKGDEKDGFLEQLRRSSMIRFLIHEK